MHAQRALSGAKDVVSIPGDDATPEQRDAFYKTLGRPDAPTGYQFTPAEGQQNNPEMESWARDTFFKAGLSGPQAHQLYEAWNQNIQQMQQAEGARMSADVQAIRQELGAGADQAISQGKEAVKALGLNAQDLMSIERAAGTPAMMRLLINIGKGMQGENGKFVGGNGSGAEASVENMTPEQAQSEIQRLRSDENFDKMYRTTSHPGHKEAARKLERLYRQAYPG